MSKAQEDYRSQGPADNNDEVRGAEASNASIAHNLTWWLCKNCGQIIPLAPHPAMQRHSTSDHATDDNDENENPPSVTPAPTMPNNSASPAAAPIAEPKPTTPSPECGNCKVQMVYFQNYHHAKNQAFPTKVMRCQHRLRRPHRQ